MITGAGGSLGRVLVPYLMRQEPLAKIVIVIRRLAGEPRNNPQLSIVCGDLRDASLWSKLPESITHVFHLAAAIPKTAAEGESKELVRDNLLPIARLMEQSAKWPNLRQVIYSSSVSVYGSAKGTVTEKMPVVPANSYGAAKLAGEQILGCLEARDVSVVSLRYSSLYGPGMSPYTVLPKMIECAVKKKPIEIWGCGKRTQDFLSCKDAARANFLAFRRNAAGTYNIGSGSFVTMERLSEFVNEVYAGGKTKIIFRSDKTESDSGVRMDIAKARRELGYSVTLPIESGLRWLKLNTNGKTA